MSNEHKHFVAPLKIYIATFASLLVLTVITVAVSRIDFGSMNIVIAMAVAFIKASIVGLFFMGLRWDKKINVLFFVGSILFLAIFLGISSLDLFYRHDTDPLESQRFGFKSPVKIIKEVEQKAPSANTTATEKQPTANAKK